MFTGSVSGINIDPVIFKLQVQSDKEREEREREKGEIDTNFIHSEKKKREMKGV